MRGTHKGVLEKRLLYEFFAILRNKLKEGFL
jgi:hypothetical protein